MTRPPGPEAAPRGRPRSAAVDRAVIDTVLRLLGDGVSLAELSMERIAREAGVGKATVYRRWAGKDALLWDVLAAVEIPVAEPVGESLREDLIAAVESVRRHHVAKSLPALMRSIQTVPMDSALWRRYYDTVVVARRATLARILERGLATGEIRPELGDDMECLIDLVAGPVLARAAQRPEALLQEDLAERVVDALLAGFRPRG